MEKRIFKIPVGTMTPVEAQEAIRKMMEKYSGRYWVLEERRKKLDKIFKR